MFYIVVTYLLCIDVEHIIEHIIEHITNYDNILHGNLYNLGLLAGM